MVDPIEIRQIRVQTWGDIEKIKEILQGTVPIQVAPTARGTVALLPFPDDRNATREGSRVLSLGEEKNGMIRYPSNGFLEYEESRGGEATPHAPHTGA